MMEKVGVRRMVMGHTPNFEVSRLNALVERREEGGMEKRAQTDASFFFLFASFRSQGIQTRCNATILLIDTGISPAYGSFIFFSSLFLRPSLLLLFSSNRT